MATLAEIQDRDPEPDDAVADRLEGEALDRYIDGHGASYALMRGPRGTPSVRKSFYCRQDDVFWLPPRIAGEHANAQPRVVVAFMHESADALVAAIIEGDACLVTDGEWQGWLRLEADRVFSFVAGDEAGWWSDRSTTAVV
jgi:hypothetical protein